METAGSKFSTEFRQIIADQQQANLERLLTYKNYMPITYEEFKMLLTNISERILLRRSVKRQFEIDKNNGPVIKQLYLYLTNNPQCEWNLNAGINFGGNVGCGKSVLMMAFIEISNQYTRRLTTSLHSKQLAQEIKSRGIEYYRTRPMFIDEIGREESKANDYGNVIKPMIDLFSMRYETGARTYATTNFKYDSLKPIYGDFIIDRMQEMMTLVVIPGESRRLNNEVKR